MHREFIDSREGFSEAEEHATRCCPECLYDHDECVCTDWDKFGEWADGLDEEYDGQPSEYDEWQDYMGGDDWDHGQYDCSDDW